MFRHTCTRLLGVAFASLAAAACDLDGLQTEVTTDEQGAGLEHETDELACRALESMLAADLPRSAGTPDNAYRAQSFADWCLENIVADEVEQFVGNANAWNADEDDALVLATSPSGRAQRATLAQGARLDIHVLEPEGTIPFRRKVHFADWQGPNGSCALEMRIYQRDLGASGLRPLLYFHGGGWRNRTTTYTAAEILTSHLTDSHVVFMPAYPLHDAKDGPDECRNARFEDILAVAQQAFDWVRRHKDVFGATGAARIDLMGHSAGGQLASYIATRNREAAGRLVNFYGPVEFADFINEADGRYADSFADAKALLASLLRVDSLVDVPKPYPEVVMQNSLREILAAQGAGALPPFFMVQGNADETVPVEQALLSCNALGGSATTEGGRHDCGDAGHVAIIDGGGHNLDRRCIESDDALAEAMDIGEFLTAVCPTREADRAAARAAARDAFDWLARE